MFMYALGHAEREKTAAAQNKNRMRSKFLKIIEAGDVAIES